MIDLAQKFESVTASRRAYEQQLKKAGGLGQQLLTSDSGMSGLTIGQTDQEDAYRMFRNWPYAIFNLIAKRVASQPVHAGEIVNARPNQERVLRGQILKKQLPSRIYQKAVIDKDLEMIPDHPVIDSLCRPNAFQKKFEFLYMLATNLFLTGECYYILGVAEAGDDGERVEMYAIPSSWVQPIHKKGLFAEFLVTPTGVTEGFVLPKENVSRTYLPNPSDPKGSFSALGGVSSAIKTDDYIQTSQQQMFEQGLTPNLVVTVAAERAIDGVMRRPILTGEQRRQITRALREVMSRQVNAGDPAILDGLIESIHKLNLTPQEMDWISSSDLVKRRIFQATGLNPITAGEIVSANRAQAAEAERQTCVNAINPIIDALSESFTESLGPMFESPERLVVWIEPCEPMDRELNDKRWATALTNDVVSKGEFRVHQLNLEAGEDAVERNNLLSTAGGMTGSVQILSAMGQGFIPRSAASELLQVFLQVDEDQAGRLVGEGEVQQAPTVEEPAVEVDDEAPEDVDEIAEETQAEIVQKLVQHETLEALAVISSSIQGTLDAITDKQTEYDRYRRPSMMSGGSAAHLSDLMNPVGYRRPSMMSGGSSSHLSDLMLHKPGGKP